MSRTRALLTILALICTVALICVAQEASNPNRQKLLNPASANEKAPDKYQAKFDTSKGSFVIEVTRAWAPNGADRFYNLVKDGFYDGARFYRVVAEFMVQFGYSGNPKIDVAWTSARIPDDPVKQSNLRGNVTFAMAGPNTRTTQVFINYSDRNAYLDKSGFAPFGKVIEGMKVVDSIYSGYGDFPSFGGHGPDGQLIYTQGNAYLEKSFPKLDFIKTATIVTK